MEQLAGRLEQVYAENGSWDFLRENPRLFYDLAEQSGDTATAERPKELNQRTDAPPFPITLLAEVARIFYLTPYFALNSSK